MNISNDKAKAIGTLPLSFLKLPSNVSNWQSYETEDIFATNFINFPHEYMFTLGSGISPSYGNLFSSLATTPAFSLPTDTQFYIAGRTVVRWGGPTDPKEIDMDHYGFTPDLAKGVALVWKAPKTEPHHLSTVPELLNNTPQRWLEIAEAIKKGEFT